MACSVWRWRSLSARGPWWPRPPKELSVKLPSVPWGRRGASFMADVQSSGVSDSLRPCELSPTRLLCPWDFPDRNTGVDCHFLLQRIFPTLDQTHVSCVGKWILYRRATGKPGSASGWFKTKIQTCCLQWLRRSNALLFSAGSVLSFKMHTCTQTLAWAQIYKHITVTMSKYWFG